MMKQWNELSESRKHRLKLFVFYFTVITALYFSLLPAMHWFVSYTHITILNSIFGLLVFCGIQLVMAKHMRLSLVDLGIKRIIPKDNLLVTLLITVLFCLILVVFKWMLIQCIDGLEGLPLFSPMHTQNQAGQSLSEFTVWVIAIAYLLFCPFQVFLIHSAIQGVVMDLFPTKMGRYGALILAVIAMSLIHLPIDVAYALIVIIPAILWAVLYLKYRCLITVTISHALIGFWAFFILDYDELINLFNLYLSSH